MIVSNAGWPLAGADGPWNPFSDSQNLSEFSEKFISEVTFILYIFLLCSIQLWSIVYPSPNYLIKLPLIGQQFFLV